MTAGAPGGREDAQASDLLSAVQAELPAAAKLRHQIHRHPDLGGHEEPTAAAIAAALGAADAPRVTQGRLIGIGDGPGPLVAIRAELDALPVTETTGAPWASVNGAMHACGHDVHMAALVAVGRALQQAGGPRPALAVLQPREESLPSGARDIVESAELAARPVGAFLGVHLHPSLPAGTIAVQAGPVNASADDFTVTITGQPGHAAYPQLARDPIVAAAATVMALQHLISRRINPMHPAVLTVGALRAGTVSNAIPEKAVLEGTLRAFDEADRAQLHDTVRQTAALTAQAYGCSADVSIGLGEPVLRNDAALAAATAPWLARLGLDPAGDMRSCGSDDFAFYNGAFPSLMCFVGVGDRPVPGLHHPGFLPPDEAIFDVARVMLGAYLGACDVLADQDPARAAASST
ncbi:MAG TPA: M20 family metallopeptidase [Streptosporangiaceae bacterium]|jgi:amidohydrolase